ncbi:MAG: hypothetical protein JST51_11795 [Armatimonadetes bacterium]|nr:hypothetical protein [Armatimonadota bacterium]
MPNPVLIIHGVANHTREPFEASVAQLQKDLDAKKKDHWKLIPVFWGDLGGQSQDISDCLPALKDGDWTVRSEAADDMLPTPVRGDLGSGRLTNRARAEILVSGGGPAVRSARSQSDLLDIVSEALSETRVLQHIDNPEALAGLREAVLAAANSAEKDDAGKAPTSGDEEEVRTFTTSGSEPETFETRGAINDVVRRVVKGVDDMLGKMLGNDLGVLNQRLRAGLAVPFSLFFGDIIVYQNKKDEIQQRIWDKVDEHAPGYGTKAQPIQMISHSLGGLVVFDALLRPENDPKRLHLITWTTFGSQPAFFHIIDPRSGLSVYKHGEKVRLPDTLGKWTNLWDTMDILAFTAGTAFELHDGSAPTDIPVQDPLSLILEEKLWTHSIYWHTEELMNALLSTLV